MKSLILGIIGAVFNFLVYFVFDFLLGMVAGSNAVQKDVLEMAEMLRKFYLILSIANLFFAILSVKWKGAAGFLTFIAVLSLMTGIGFIGAIFDFIAASACKSKFAKKKQKELEAKIAALEAATAAAQKNDEE